MKIELTDSDVAKIYWALTQAGLEKEQAQKSEIAHQYYQLADRIADEATANQVNIGEAD